VPTQKQVTKKFREREREREEAGTRGKEAALCSFCEYYYTRN